MMILQLRSVFLINPDKNEVLIFAHATPFIAWQFHYRIAAKNLTLEERYICPYFAYVF